MLGVWTPRLRIWSFLAVIAIVAVLLAFIRPAPRGTLRFSKLRHAEAWSVAPPGHPGAGSLTTKGKAAHD